MEWTDKLATGVRTIDSQHKELFKRINSLVTAIRQQRCKSEIDDMIKFLDDYARVHFSEEEKHMRETNYAGLDQQHQDHRRFLTALAELKQQASLPRVRGSTYNLSATTNQVVVDWIVSHIMNLDMKFGEYLKQQGKEY